MMKRAAAATALLFLIVPASSFGAGEMRSSPWYKRAIARAARQWLPATAQNITVTDCFHGTHRIMVCRVNETGLNWITWKPDPDGYGTMYSIDAERSRHNRQRVHVFSCEGDQFDGDRCSTWGAAFTINKTVVLQSGFRAHSAQWARKRRMAPSAASRRLGPL